ncbi:MAG: hypothetical protein HN910_09315 [Porticoccaceae bacterium]|jgi:hypothetical protein|nr:hypothetical protein [Candidatus Neomarinimicrobiota bacterium]MBT7168984.1 hypothetical protein [Porticoccaceae bacterium]
MSIALVYLARGSGDGLLAARKFFDAYRAFPPGCPHDLIVISKGWAEIGGRQELERMAQQHSARIIDLPDHGYDFGAYMRLAPTLTQDWICFLSTNSRPRIDGWLNLLWVAARSGDKDVGAVGPTGSLGTIAQFPWPPSPTANLRALFLFPLLPLRLLFHAIWLILKIKDFPIFPNPHLRSSTFMVRRDIFTDFVGTHKIPNTKYQAHMLESGRTGLTAFVKNRGFRTLVAGMDGKVYEPDQWVNSRTFRYPKPLNLLVEDRQTITYEMADTNNKRTLEAAAWGQTFS